MSKNKIAIIGASYLQVPLINKAKEMGLETHVFAWQVGDEGEKIADYFYPISIVEKEQILNKCKDIGISGICSIASDLATLTVNYVAQNLGLISNNLDCTLVSTNKHLMRERFKERGDPSPLSVVVDESTNINELKLAYPVLIKPTDRSGSRGIFKLDNNRDLETAVNYAIGCSFEKKALIEEFVDGDEYSVEFISWEGEHKYITTTKKFTTGAPHFIETGHLEPAPLDINTIDKIKNIVSHALTSLGVEYGASHSEVKINTNEIKIIEIGARMGGDFIGSDLVQLSTGYDFVKNVINVSLGIEPEIPTGKSINKAIVEFELDKNTTDSSNRTGYHIKVEELE